MKFYNKVTGDEGEIIAQKYLKKKKYRILETNFHSKIGEIDIIAQKCEQIVFIEVKTRESLAFGQPSEAVDKHKQWKIHQVAEAYLIKNRLIDYPCRFDVIEILDGEINHIENAF